MLGTPGGWEGPVEQWEKPAVTKVWPATGAWPVTGPGSTLTKTWPPLIGADPLVTGAGLQTMTCLRCQMRASASRGDDSDDTIPLWLALCQGRPLANNR